MTTRLSTKGQLIIPHEVRERHGWGAGTELLIEDRGDAVILRSVERGTPVTLDELVGCVRYPGPSLSLEQMAAGIRRGAPLAGRPQIELLPSTP